MPKLRTSLLLVILSLLTIIVMAKTRNNFTLDAPLVPIDEIHSGGPEKDGIPAIDKPSFLMAGKEGFLSDDAPVLGVSYNGISKAYPINILNWHEVVNDFFKKHPVVITFCPLCGSGMAFSANIKGKATTFGVSGLLYNSDVLLYDRETNSLWSQLMSQAINGPQKGEYLKNIPVVHTTWLDWKTHHPNTLLLSTKTGHNRDYSSSPYTSYLRSTQLYFPVSISSQRYHPKEITLGVEINGKFKAYPFVELEKSAAVILDTISGQQITIRYDKENRSAQAFNENNKQMPAVRVFWFAWFAFHPKTEIYTAPPS